jgi:hypothetical protein
MPEAPSLGELLIFLAIALIINWIFKRISPFWAKKTVVRGWTMYERVRDMEQFHRYSDRIHDMLFDDWHKGHIDGSEYERWCKRFSWMPDFKTYPTVKPKEAIRTRLKYRYDHHGRRVGLNTNLDEVFSRHFPNFREEAVPPGKPVLQKTRNMFPHLEMEPHDVLRSNAVSSS